MPQKILPERGDVWLADLDLTRGREQAGRHPVLVVSVHAFNQSKAGLVVVIPLTSTPRGIRWHVGVAPPDGGLKNASFLMSEAVRSISQERLLKRWGSVSLPIIEEVEDRLRILLNL